jgi:hypothetical protein
MIDGWPSTMSWVAEPDRRRWGMPASAVLLCRGERRVRKTSGRETDRDRGFISVGLKVQFESY